MYYGEIKDCDIANGEGVRVTLFVSGCTNRCPNCGAQVAQGLKFCGECGSPMQTSNVCPQCGFENAPGMKFCGGCGNKL